MARTTAGRDLQAKQLGDPSSNATGAYASASWMAITADATAPAVSDTTLTGELTGGTMGRVQGTFAHTTGTASYTLTNTFTADRSVVVAKCGLFNASSGGTMAFEQLLDFTADLKSGDTLQVTATVSL